MNWVRIILLAWALLGAVAWGAMKWRPDWVKPIDGYFVERHMRPVAGWTERLADKSPLSDEEITDIRTTLESLESAQREDRLHTHWRKLSQRLVKELVARKEFGTLTEVLRGLLEKEPRNVPWRLRLADALSSSAEPRDRDEALEHTTAVLAVFPDWDPAQRQHVLAQCRQKDWSAAADSLRGWGMGPGETHKPKWLAPLLKAYPQAAARLAELPSTN